MEPRYTPQETAQLVLDQVRMYPETHDQCFWDSWQAHVQLLIQGQSSGV